MLTDKKLDDHRITLGVLLNDLKARVGAGEAGKGVKWWSWYGEHFQNRSRRDAERVMRLASSDDPQAAADEERTKAREGMAAHRKKIATNVSRDLQPASAPEGYRHTEEEVAAGIARDVETEIAAWEEEGLDLDLIRELVLSKLKDGADREEKAEPPKRRGRPPGSKNKPKEAAPAEEPPEPAPATGAPAAPTTTPPATALILRTALRSVGPITTTTSAIRVSAASIRPISRCNHEHRTLYGHATCRAPHARREIRLLLILSCDFFSRQRT